MVVHASIVGKKNHKFACNRVWQKKKEKKERKMLWYWLCGGKQNDIACDCRNGKLEWYFVPKTKNKKKENSMFYIYIYNGKKFRISWVLHPKCLRCLWF